MARNRARSSTTAQAVVSSPAQPRFHRPPCRRPGSLPWPPWPRGCRGLPETGRPAAYLHRFLQRQRPVWRTRLRLVRSRWSRPRTIRSGAVPFVVLVMTVLQECQRGPAGAFWSGFRYLTGPRFRHRIEAVVERFSDMQADLSSQGTGCACRPARTVWHSNLARSSYRAADAGRSVGREFKHRFPCYRGFDRRDSRCYPSPHWKCVSECTRRGLSLGTQ
jgi:hypothetical protein